MTDADLVAAAAAGDGDAAGTLVRRHYEECWQFAFRMLGNRHDAEDVVQETFLRALRALGRYREQDRFRAWLFRILTNTCRTALLQRRRRKHWFLSVDSHALDRLAGPGEPPRDMMVELSRETALAATLRCAALRLDAKHREAFLLKYGAGMSYTEMAEATGAGVSALKMRVKRACDALRPILCEVLDDL